MNNLLEAFFFLVPLFFIWITGTIGLTKDPVGLIFCAIFIAVEIVVVRLLFYESHVNFRSSLVRINSLDLTFKQDLRRKLAGRRPTLRESLIEQGSWLHRHGFGKFR